MADYFTNFSFIFKLPTPAACTAALELAALASEYDAEAGHQLPAPIAELVEDWRFETQASGDDGCGLWLHSSSGGIDAVCGFIQYLLQTYDPQGSAGIQWSHDCSRPRTDAYGGGAAFITASKIKIMNTATWLLRHENQNINRHASARRHPITQ